MATDDAAAARILVWCATALAAGAAGWDERDLCRTMAEVLPDVPYNGPVAPLRLAASRLLKAVESGDASKIGRARFDLRMRVMDYARRRAGSVYERLRDESAA